ncbi:flavin reductase family protein [Streptomyces fulvoviolaceus]|uniref:flavin reductase family protein n=1 Tax=Streptomyces fulvoviolaceus TaxID=285535 RepID=UPI0007C528E6|nr:flavin reductase family protein [Streptomyces fulvoviolaceus]MCT9083691.1 flavin reductase family protein [Streptomyces fulvoviolaceus]
MTGVRELTAVRDVVPAEDFRAAMLQWASGVTVVTAVDGDRRPQGFTASSFCSVSLDPPLVLVCLDRGANCLETFRETGWFAVHVLGEDQEELALRFARKGTGKFADERTVPGLGEAPLLTGALARLECRAVDRVPAGDHLILVGRVARTETRSGRPLVHCQRAFHGLRQRSPHVSDPTKRE